MAESYIGWLDLDLSARLMDCPVSYLSAWGGGGPNVSAITFHFTERPEVEVW